jgi:hypothetical protein
VSYNRRFVVKKSNAFRNSNKARRPVGTETSCARSRIRLDSVRSDARRAAHFGGELFAAEEAGHRWFGKVSLQHLRLGVEGEAPAEFRAVRPMLLVFPASRNPDSRRS